MALLKVIMLNFLSTTTWNAIHTIYVVINKLRNVLANNLTYNVSKLKLHQKVDFTAWNHSFEIYSHSRHSYF